MDANTGPRKRFIPQPARRHLFAAFLADERLDDAETGKQIEPQCGHRVLQISTDASSISRLPARPMGTASTTAPALDEIWDPRLKPRFSVRTKAELAPSSA